MLTSSQFAWPPALQKPQLETHFHGRSLARLTNVLAQTPAKFAKSVKPPKPERPGNCTVLRILATPPPLIGQFEASHPGKQHVKREKPRSGKAGQRFAAIGDLESLARG